MVRKRARLDQGITLDMSFNEMIGAIFMRSQIIEQLMREMIQLKTDHLIPNNFEKLTYGRLLTIFKDLYPDICIPYDSRLPQYHLLGDLNDAKEARDDAAHGHFLTGIFIMDLLHDYGSVLSKRRFIMKGLRKDLWVIDDAMRQLMVYSKSHGWVGWTENKIGDRPTLPKSEMLQ